MRQTDISFTVIITVFNRESTLRRTLDSALEQEVDFEYKILVIDDGSTDGSKEIIAEYEKKYPELIYVYYNEVNHRLGYTILLAYEMLDTKYFAVLDADDYWINKRKVSKAVHFLEEHPDYSSYGSNFYVEADGEGRVVAVDIAGDNSASNVLEMRFLQTSASVFRNVFDEKILNKMKELAGNRRSHPFQADTFRNHLSIEFGKQYYEDSLDAVYYIGKGNGIWSGMTPIERAVINTNIYYELYVFLSSAFEPSLNSDYCFSVSRTVYEQAVDLLAELLKQHKLEELRLSKYYQEVFRIEDDEQYDMMIELVKFEQLLK